MVHKNATGSTLVHFSTAMLLIREGNMDGEVLKKLAKLKLLVKRSGGQSIEVSTIISDRQYARNVLTAAEESDNEELILLALELKDALGLLATVPEPAPAEARKPEPEPPSSSDKIAGRYMFGARG